MSAPKFAPGDVVRYSGRHLRQIGAATGDAGTRRWTVKACECAPCREGRWVNLGAWLADYECWLHCAPGALVKVGGAPSRRDVDVDPAFPYSPE